MGKQVTSASIPRQRSASASRRVNTSVPLPPLITGNQIFIFFPRSYLIGMKTQPTGPLHLQREKAKKKSSKGYETTVAEASDDGATRKSKEFS